MSATASASFVASKSLLVLYTSLEETCSLNLVEAFHMLCLDVASIVTSTQPYKEEEINGFLYINSLSAITK